MVMTGAGGPQRRIRFVRSPAKRGGSRSPHHQPATM